MKKETVKLQDEIDPNIPNEMEGDEIQGNERVSETQSSLGLDPRTIQMFKLAAAYVDLGARVRIVFGGKRELAEIIINRELFRLQADSKEKSKDDPWTRITILDRDGVYKIEYQAMTCNSFPRDWLLVDWAIIEMFSGPIIAMYTRFNQPTP